MTECKAKLLACGELEAKLEAAGEDGLSHRVGGQALIQQQQLGAMDLGARRKAHPDPMLRLVVLLDCRWQRVYLHQALRWILGIHGGPATLLLLLLPGRTSVDLQQEASLVPRIRQQQRLESLAQVKSRPSLVMGTAQHQEQQPSGQMNQRIPERRRCR